MARKKNEDKILNLIIFYSTVEIYFVQHVTRVLFLKRET